MGITFCGLVLLAICTARTVATESCLDSEYEDEVSVVLWESLFTKINSILSETSRLAESQKALSEGQRAISETLRALSENQKAMSESLAELKDKHEAEGRKLSEFMEDTEKKLSILEERQLLQTTKGTEFIKSAEENFKGMKQGQAAQQQKLSHFMDQYLDNNVEWTTILRRQDGSVDFYRNWAEYKKGFGQADGEFFIGLEKLHNLTANGAPQELLIILKDNENEKRIAKYDLFKIGNEAEKYALLELGAYSGDAGDSLIGHKGIHFTTYDQDNDKLYRSNCAEAVHGAWWFHGCYHSHLFGVYKPTKSIRIAWNLWEQSSLKFAEMKIRPKIPLAV